MTTAPTTTAPLLIFPKPPIHTLEAEWRGVLIQAVEDQSHIATPAEDYRPEVRDALTRPWRNAYADAVRELVDQAKEETRQLGRQRDELAAGLRRDASSVTAPAIRGRVGRLSQLHRRIAEAHQTIDRLQAHAEDADGEVTWVQTNIQPVFKCVVGQMMGFHRWSHPMRSQLSGGYHTNEPSLQTTGGKAVIRQEEATKAKSQAPAAIVRAAVAFAQEHGAELFELDEEAHFIVYRKNKEKKRCR